MPLSFQPACLPVAHGGLPHRYGSQALNLLFQTTPGLLNCPQLPQRSFYEQAYVQCSMGFPGLVLDESSQRIYVDRKQAEHEIDQLCLAYLQNKATYAALPPEKMPVLSELRRGLVQGHNRLAVGSQIQGPISAALQITDDQHRPLIYDPMLREGLAQFLTLRISWLIDQLSDLGPEVIICLNEPFLDAFALPSFPLDWEDGHELLEMVLTSISGGCRGLIVNGGVNWIRLFATSVEYIHFNAYHYGASLLEAPRSLADYLDRSGVIAWGIVPSDADDLAGETAATLLIRMEYLIEQLVAAGLSQEQLLQTALISTSDSLAHVPVQMADHAMALCAEISTLVRKKYGLI